MPSRRHPSLPLVTVALTSLVSAASAATPACNAHSGPTVTPVIELYTSEGCSSCPPADRWLSRLKAEPSVVALAFHVDYWDRLGWTDRFARAEFTRRQAEQQQVNGARFSYTPQWVLDGIDRPGAPSQGMGLLTRPHPASTVEVQLMRTDSHLTATVRPLAGAPTRLAAYWAVTEHDHVSAVQAGENRGATLRHDFVVRDYRPVAAWAPRDGSMVSLPFETATAADPAHARQINFVVIDAGSGRPVQAVRLGC